MHMLTKARSVGISPVSVQVNGTTGLYALACVLPFLLLVTSLAVVRLLSLLLQLEEKMICDILSDSLVAFMGGNSSIQAADMSFLFTNAETSESATD